MDSIGKSFFIAGVVALPLSYALKQIFGIPSAIWIDPTLIIALAIYALIPGVSLNRSAAVTVLTAVALGVHGFYLLRPEGTAWQAFHESMRIPIQLALCMLWLSASQWAATRYPRVLIKWLTIVVICELVIGIILMLCGLGVFHFPIPALNEYSVRHVLKQTRYIRGFWWPRLCGTFDEGPIFGLFMFSAFVVFALMRSAWPSRNRWLQVGLGASSLGLLGSASDEIFLGAGCFAAFAIAGAVLKGRKVKLTVTISCSVGLLLAVFAVRLLLLKRTTEASVAMHLEGTSVDERVFNVEYGLGELLGSNSEALLLGVGPDRFGDYAFASGRYNERSVTLQVTPVEWLVGYGVVGTAVIALWLCTIGYFGWRNYGMLGCGAVLGLLVADIAQSNWVWASWFMALGCLCTRPRIVPSKKSRWVNALESCRRPA